jgi:COP9 signalosome complex subunit 5
MSASSGTEKDQLAKLGAAGSKIAREEDMGLLAAKVKDQVFNLKGGQELGGQEVEMKS